MPWWRQSSLHFLVLGALLYAVLPDATGNDEPAPIVLSGAFLDGLAAEEELASGHRPRNAVERGGLRARFLREEVLFREALRLGLQAGDPIIRRRLIQKMEFLLQSEADAAEPSEAQLAAYYEANEARYENPPRRSFRHVFFPAEGHADPLAAARENRGAAPFLQGDAFALRSEAQVQSIFGQDFARALFESGDDELLIESVYGAHRVHIEARQDALAPPLEAVRATVNEDWRQDARERALATAVASLLEQYPVVER